MATRAMEAMPTPRRLKAMQTAFRFAELLTALSVDTSHWEGENLHGETHTTPSCGLDLLVTDT